MLVRAVGNLLYRHRQSALHCPFPGIHHHLNAMPELLPLLWWVIIGKKAHLSSHLLYNRKVLLPVGRAQHRHTIENADALQPHTIRRTLHEKEFLLLCRRSPCRINAKKHLTFVEENAIRRVEIFRLGVAHRARRETDDPS